MCSRTFVLTLLCCAIPGAAFAQAGAPEGQPLGGPAVPGVCLLSREAVFANAKVGVAAGARLQQLAEQAQAEVETERKPLESELQAFRAQAASLPPEQRNAREQALGAKLQAAQAKSQQRGRELDATRVKVMERISAEAQPLIAQAYKAANCGLLLDRNAVLGGNMAGDLTGAVVKALDAKITTISFNRETLPAASAGARP